MKFNYHKEVGPSPHKSTPVFNDFFTQLAANLLATVVGAIIVYLLIERRYRDFENNKTTKRLIINLYEEIIRNYVVTERIEALSPSVLRSNQFPISKFDTEATSSFAGLKPIAGEEKFYLKLKSVVTNMENTNRLIDLIFMGKTSTVLANKKIVYSSAPKIKRDLNAVLKKIVVLNKDNKYFNQEAA